jgi:DNA-directed RNA polymerase subunit alpha
VNQSVTPKVEYSSSKGYGRFVVGPLETGYGVTLGNALRRVLLSSLPGAAVTKVRIEGVQHEFSVIPHIKEDTMELLLNIKEIRLRPLSEHSGKLILDVAGEGIVHAGDVIPSPDFEIANPELYLATLDSDEAKLNMELYVERGKGYLLAKQDDNLPIGVLPLDAIFTPVRRVNYTVEKVRVGQVTDYDQLILEVWTDETISPEEAVGRSAQLLLQHFSLFSALGGAPVEAKKELLVEPYDMPIEQLGVSKRTISSLKRNNIHKVDKLLGKSKSELEAELLGKRGLGQKSFVEVWSCLEALGLIPKAAEEEVTPAVAGVEQEIAPAEGEISEEEALRRLQAKFRVKESK